MKIEFIRDTDLTTIKDGQWEEISFDKYEIVEVSDIKEDNAVIGNDMRIVELTSTGESLIIPVDHFEVIT